MCKYLIIKALSLMGGGICKIVNMIHLVRNGVYSIYLSSKLKEAPAAHFQYPVELRGGNRISIGRKSYFHPFLELCAWESYGGDLFAPYITIGDGCSFGSNNHISSINAITIGSNFLSGRNVSIVDNNHGDFTQMALQLPPLERKLTTKGPILIGDNVWVGDKVTILGGVHIGDGVVIAANSVVTKDIPSYCLAAGNPASVVKQLNI